VEIEEVVHNNPDAIVKVAVEPGAGYQPYIGRILSNALGLDPAQAKEADAFYRGLYKLYVDSDCSIAEINPLVLTADNQMIALDAKLNFDENAMFRHPEIAAYRDLTEESAKEVEASKYGLSYIELDGNIGCLVNGAGLAMATLDIVQLHGGNAANFLDVGGGATKEAVEQAFRIILSDPNVKAILVNIFGGIMKCDIIAEGVVAAAKAVSLNVPLVVRLEGTNVDLGKKILNESGLAITAAGDLGDAAKKVVAAAKGA